MTHVRQDGQLLLNNQQSDYLYKLAAAASEMKAQGDVVDHRMLLNRNRLMTGEIPEIIDHRRYDDAVGQVRALIGAAGLAFGEYTESVDEIVSAVTANPNNLGWVFDAHKRWELSQ